MAEPRIRFLIGGAQKCGTSALAEYLTRHPNIALPSGKEAHVFDDPGFDEAWSADQVDSRFNELFGPPRDDVLCGDATPITMFHPRLVRRVAAYNPAMRWIVLLRHPVERAISHYFMERRRGNEPLGLLAAVLAEPRRCRGHADDWSAESPLRTWTYTARGRYAAQLEALMEHFPRDQVLLLRSRDLAETPSETVRCVIEFLGLRKHTAEGRFEPVFEGGYPPPPRWSPGRLALHCRLIGEVGRVRSRFGVDLTG